MRGFFQREWKKLERAFWRYEKRMYEGKKVYEGLNDDGNGAREGLIYALEESRWHNDHVFVLQEDWPMFHITE